MDSEFYAEGVLNVYCFLGGIMVYFEESKLESVRMGTNMNFKIIDLENIKKDIFCIIK